MTWHLDLDDRDSVTLVHDDGYRLSATKRMERDPDGRWQFEVLDTVNGQELLRRSHPVADEDALWVILDDYAERYPP